MIRRWTKAELTAVLWSSAAHGIETRKKKAGNPEVPFVLHQVQAHTHTPLWKCFVLVNVVADCRIVQKLKTQRQIERIGKKKKKKGSLVFLEEDLQLLLLLGETRN